MNDRSGLHRDVGETDVRPRHAAPGKRTLTDNLHGRSRGAGDAGKGRHDADDAQPAASDDAVDLASADDPFGLHLLDEPVGEAAGEADEAPSADDQESNVQEARRFNLQHTAEVVRFNSATHGVYAPPGGGQFDPEDIMAWQAQHQHDDPENPLEIDGRLTPATMKAVANRPSPTPRARHTPRPRPDPLLPPGPKPKPRAKPNSPQVGYPEFDDLANAVWNAMHYTMLATRDGVTRAAAELKTHDELSKFDPHAETFIKESAKESLKKAADEIVLHYVSTAIKIVGAGWIAGIAESVDDLWESVKGVVAPATTKRVESPPDSKVEIFAQAQTRTTTRAAFHAEEDFLLKTKPAYRAEERDQPGAGMTKMRLDLAGLHAQRERAEKVQHDKALHAWTLALAHEDAGEYVDPETHQSQGTKILDDGDKHKLRQSLRTGRGVLQVKFLGFGPQNGILIESVTVKGLPKVARDQLVGRTVNDANLPIIADGRVRADDGGEAPFTIGLAAGELHTENIEGQIDLKQYFHWEANGDRNAARRWLALRADPQAGDGNEAEAWNGGRKALLEAIGNQTIAAISDC